MGVEHFISETEAIALSGVSEKTLQRFTEAGYLSIERESDGLRLYSENELRKVFSLSGELNSTTIQAQPTRISIPEETENSNGYASLPSSGSDSASYYSIPRKRPIATGTDLKGKISRVSGVTTPATAQTANQTRSEISLDRTRRPLEQHVHESETTRLKKVIEVNEKIIQLREEQISELRSERDWLRNQVEKLEEKASRDQVLLLSESQIIRQFLEQQNSKKSTMRSLLEWVGVLPPETRMTKSPVIAHDYSE
ncbi:MAG: hypothetical protein KDD60_07020 [Bdellovibrionales bacterium]|nr:hypothetical protein [Bdellovibrionales bacterium]